MEGNLPLIADFLEYMRGNKSITSNQLIQLYVLALLIFLPIIWSFFKKIYTYVIRKKLQSDLHPFYSGIEIKKATEYYIPTKCQNVPPHQEVEPRKSFAFAVRTKLIPFFLTKAFTAGEEDQRFYLVLADSGMGKTTFMINLYLRYIRKLFKRAYKIKLVPLGHPKGWEEINKIDDAVSKETILLLDAFDEDADASKDYIQRLNQIVNLSWRFRKVVITSRTQFFPNEEKEPHEINIPKVGGEPGFHRFVKIYLSPFDDNDIKKYLRKKFGLLHLKRRRIAFEIVKKSPNLMVRPMLLSYVDDLLDTAKTFNYTFQTYEALIAKWIEREASRIHGKDERTKFTEELNKFSKAIALNMYRHRDARKGLYTQADEIKSFAKQHNIHLEDIEMKSRSLLNRDADGKYKFAHKSILEYILAYEALINEDFKNEFSFKGMDAAKLFYGEMCWNSLLPFLKNTEGFFTIYGSDRPKEIREIVSADFREIRDITIHSNITQIPLHYLSALPMLKSISILNRIECEILYDFYKFLLKLAISLYKFREIVNHIVLSTLDLRPFADSDEYYHKVKKVRVMIGNFYFDNIKKEILSVKVNILKTIQLDEVNKRITDIGFLQLENELERYIEKVDINELNIDETRDILAVFLKETQNSSKNDAIKNYYDRFVKTFIGANFENKLLLELQSIEDANKKMRYLMDSIFFQEDIVTSLTNLRQLKNPILEKILVQSLERLERLNLINTTDKNKKLDSLISELEYVDIIKRLTTINKDDLIKTDAHLKTVKKLKECLTCQVYY